MFKSFECWTLICDKCGKDVNAGTDYSGFDDKGYVMDCARDDNWIVKDDKHYCPDCYYYNDDDELTILHSQAKKK